MSTTVIPTMRGCQAHHLIATFAEKHVASKHISVVILETSQHQINCIKVNNQLQKYYYYQVS